MYNMNYNVKPMIAHIKMEQVLLDIVILHDKFYKGDDSISTSEPTAGVTTKIVKRCGDNDTKTLANKVIKVALFVDEVVGKSELGEVWTTEEGKSPSVVPTLRTSSSQRCTRNREKSTAVSPLPLGLFEKEGERERKRNLALTLLSK